MSESGYESAEIDTAPLSEVCADWLRALHAEQRVEKQLAEFREDTRLRLHRIKCRLDLPKPTDGQVLVDVGLKSHDLPVYVTLAMVEGNSLIVDAIETWAEPVE